MYRRGEHPTRYRIPPGESGRDWFKGYRPQLGNGGTDWFTRFARGFVAAAEGPGPAAVTPGLPPPPRPAGTPGWVWPAVLLGGARWFSRVSWSC
jgi:hypothetical protein